MKYICFILITIAFSMCSTNQSLPETAHANAPLIIYKTKANYSNNVPVALNAEKNKIVSYPGIRDVFFNGEPALPTMLKDGYMVDNFGISGNTAYTSFSIEEYSKLKETPSVSVLFDKIIDKSPFVEIYNCGSRSQYTSIKELNKLVADNFKGCKKINID